MKLFILINFFTLFYIAFSDDRVPAVPLVVKSPYLSTWLKAGNKHLAGSWAQFWLLRHTKAMGGLIKVDGKTYLFLGDIGNNLQVVQKNLKVTPTQSIFTLEAGPVELTANFFTPIDPTDLKLLSLPGSYISLSVRSTDKAKHKVEVYLDISAEWTGNNVKETVTWSFNNKISNGKIFNYDFQLQNQRPLQEFKDQVEWGTHKFFTDSSVTYEVGFSDLVRGEFMKNGNLSNKIDEQFRAADDKYPVFAYAHDFGLIDDQIHSRFYGIAHVRHPAINYTTGPLNSLWESYFKADSNAMIEFLYDDRNKALERARALDTKITADAHQIGGDSYVKIVTAALRQAFGGTELVGTPAKPWMMVKEISSDGNCQTVDVIYPHFPVLYYLNPQLMKFELEPLLENQEGGFWPHKYCMHDLGFNYPRCIGHIDGKEEAMEVEESANMIIMVAAYFKATKDSDFVKKHYKILKQWSQYLVDHGLYTGDALTTDDFLGRIKNSTNLSIKAIVALAAMAPLATASGNAADVKHFTDVSQNYIKEWLILGQDSAGDHFKTSYNDNNQWFLLYNLFADKLLGTNLVPSQVYKKQDAWYLKNAKKYGVQLTSTKTDFTKVDWLMFYAAASESDQLKHMLYDRLASWLTDTQVTSPFNDYINIVKAEGFEDQFVNRPVIGGVFAPLAIGKHK